jgi:UDP-glucose 4-epimerase
MQSSSDKHRVLVTGGAGFIGSHLVRALVAEGHEVHVLDDFSSGYRHNLAGVPIAAMHEGTLEALPELTSRLRGVSHIVHMAALISSHDSLKEPDRYLAVNVNGTLRVIECARTLGVKRIVFASSSTVYGQIAGVCRELDVPQPLTVYASSKLTCEHLLAMYAGLVGFSYVALRMFNVYGPRQSIDHPYANVTCKFAHAAARSLPIDLYGDGEQSRDFVFVEDVVRAFLAVLSKSSRPLYNVGTGVDTSINTLLSTVEQVASVSLEKRRLPPWPNDIRSIRADVSRLADEFGLCARVTLTEGLRQTVAAFRATIDEAMAPGRSLVELP